MMEFLREFDFLVLTWAAWGGLSVVGLIFVAQMELSAVADRIGGANGLILLAALVLIAVSALGLTLVTWYLRGFAVALRGAGGVVAGVLAYLLVFQYLYKRILSRRPEVEVCPSPRR